MNATLPRGKAAEALTVEEAVQLIAERVAKGPSQAKSRGRGKSPTTKPARETAAPRQAANGAPAKSKPKKNGKDTSDSGAKAPPAGGKAPRSRKTAT